MADCLLALSKERISERLLAKSAGNMGPFTDCDAL